MRAVIDHRTTLAADAVRPTGGVATFSDDLVALSTVEWGPQPAPATLGSHDPRTLPPRGTMAHVLAVAAFEQGDPVPHLVALEADDGTAHLISLLCPCRCPAPPALRNADRHCSFAPSVDLS